LLFGKLNLPIEALRIIEESSPNPDDLQTNIGYVDECGNPSTNICLHDMNVLDHLPPSQHLQTSVPELRKFTNAAKRKRLA
jgi:hypothetical protein